MASFFDRVRAGLAKTARQIRERLGDVAGDRSRRRRVRGSAGPAGRRARRIETLEAVEDALIAADVGSAGDRAHRRGRARRSAAGSIGERVGRVMLGMLTDVRPGAGRRRRVRTSSWSSASTARARRRRSASWRTSTAATGRSVLVCAADTFRAAAVEQLAIWTERAGVDLVRAPVGRGSGGGDLRCRPRPRRAAMRSSSSTRPGGCTRAPT